MVTRQAILDYRATGARAATSEVVGLADALKRQKENAERVAPILRQAAVAHGALGAISQSAAAKVGSLATTFGPLGAGLGYVSRQGPAAATGLFQYVVAAERASMVNKLLNTTIIGGVTAMAAGSVAILAMADNAIRAGDTYATLEARIRTFSAGAIQAAEVERELYQNAKDSRSAVEGQVALYTRLAPAVADYGRSQEDALKMTALTTKALAVQGADIREQMAGTVQFSQAISSGKLGGDELRTLLESTPQLLRYMAENLEINGKVGVAFSQLRSLGEKGLLTTDKIIAALLRAEPKIEADFINAPKRAQQGWTRLMDVVVRTVGQMSKASGAQEGLVDWLGDLADATDAFRQKALLDPGAMDPIKAATRYMGEAVAGIAKLGGTALDHFDDIVQAGQAVIALKLGTVFADWFGRAAQAAKGAQSALASYREAALVSASATLNPAAAAAARGLREGADALAIRAAELQAQAELKVASAVAARAAAERAEIQVALARASVGAGSAAAAEAQATATLHLTAATRAEEQAARAVTAAETARTAASVRSTIAQEAQSLATSKVSWAMTAQGATMRVVTALYTAMGGTIGIAGLALGGIIYAIWRSEEAYRAQVAAQRDAIVVSDDLERLTQAMTAATWAQVPALLAQAQAIRDNANAARQEAEAQYALAEARRQALLKQYRQAPPTTAEGALAFNFMLGREERVRDDAKATLDAGARDSFSASMKSANATLSALAKEAMEIQRQLGNGKDAAGRPLSSSQRTQMEDRRDRLFAIGQGQVDAYGTAIRQQRAAVDREKDATKKQGLIDGLNLFGVAFNTATELVSTSDKPAIAPKAAAGKAKKTAVPGGVNQALTELFEQQYLPTAGKKDFSLKGGIINTKNGGIFTARSEDEAAAAAKYVKQILAINAATDAQIAKTGKSRDALREAASAMLAHEVATSKASQADEKWADIQAEMTGQSRDVVKAQREVNDLMESGASITEAAAQAYVDYVAARERARRLQQGLQTAEPEARKAFDQVTAGLVIPTDARGVVDKLAATKQLEDQRGAIMAESERRIRAELGKIREAEGLTQQQYEQRLADAIAANKVAVEAVLQERLLELDKDRLSQSIAYAEQRYADAADLIVGPLKDLAMGGDPKEIGQRFIDGLLSAMYDELIFSPLRKALIDAMRALFSGASGGAAGGGGGGGGTLSSFFVQIASAFFGHTFGGGGGGGGIPSASGANPYATPPFVADPHGLNVHRLAGGGKVRGPGGRRGDKIPAMLSDKEFVVNADAAERNSALLEAINLGVQPPGYANGGWIGSGGGGSPGPGPSGPMKVEIHNHTGVQADAEVSQGPGGDMKIDIFPYVKQGAKGFIASREGARAMKQAPFGPKKRG